MSSAASTPSTNTKNSLKRNSSEINSILLCVAMCTVPIELCGCYVLLVSVTLLSVVWDLRLRWLLPAMCTITIELCYLLRDAIVGCTYSLWLRLAYYRVGQNAKASGFPERKGADSAWGYKGAQAPLLAPGGN